MSNSNTELWPDHDKDHHENSDHENHLHGFDETAENLIKRVKQALADGEGCRVFDYGVHSFS